MNIFIKKIHSKNSILKIQKWLGCKVFLFFILATSTQAFATQASSFSALALPSGESDVEQMGPLSLEKDVFSMRPGVDVGSVNLTHKEKLSIFGGSVQLRFQVIGMVMFSRQARDEIYSFIDKRTSELTEKEKLFIENHLKRQAVLSVLGENAVKNSRTSSGASEKENMIRFHKKVVEFKERLPIILVRTIAAGVAATIAVSLAPGMTPALVLHDPISLWKITAAASGSFLFAVAAGPILNWIAFQKEWNPNRKILKPWTWWHNIVQTSDNSEALLKSGRPAVAVKEAMIEWAYMIFIMGPVEWFTGGFSTTAKIGEFFLRTFGGALTTGFSQAQVDSTAVTIMQEIEKITGIEIPRALFDSGSMAGATDEHRIALEKVLNPDDPELKAYYKKLIFVRDMVMAKSSLVMNSMGVGSQILKPYQIYITAASIGMAIGYKFLIDKVPSVRRAAAGFYARIAEIPIPEELPVSGSPYVSDQLRCNLIF